MADYEFVTTESVEDDASILRMMLNRPDARNAQNRGMLVELRDAFLRAEAEDRISDWRDAPKAKVAVKGAVGSGS